MGKGARNRTPARKMRRALRRTPDAYFDLIQWLLDRDHASTRKQAKQLILDGKVKADSHVLGRGTVPMMVDNKPQMVAVVLEHVPVALKPRVLVSA